MNVWMKRNAPTQSCTKARRTQSKTFSDSYFRCWIKNTFRLCFTHLTIHRLLCWMFSCSIMLYTRIEAPPSCCCCTTRRELSIVGWKMSCLCPHNIHTCLLSPYSLFFCLLLLTARVHVCACLETYIRMKKKPNSLNSAASLHNKCGLYLTE